MYDICCVGHITSDKIVNARSVMYMPGGTALYFSCALSGLNVNYLLVTALAKPEMHYVNDLRSKGIEVTAFQSANTVNFENIYAEDQDNRVQNVLQKADPFTAEQFENIEARFFHLGPLLADDIPVNLIKKLATKGIVSLDVQGYLREVKNKEVHAADWPEKKEALPFVDILKADVSELKALTGCDEVSDGVITLNQWGVKEIIITNGSRGSLVYHEGKFYNIPPYTPAVVEDATGCGDTYMAGYLYQRSKGAGIQQCALFASAMAGLKTATAGPFTGTEEEVQSFLNGNAG